MHDYTVCVFPEPETLENGLEPTDTDTVPRDDDVAVLGAGKPPVDDIQLKIEGQVHPCDEDQRHRSFSGSSYDSDGEKNEGTYISPDYSDKYKDEEDLRRDDFSPIEERDRERDSYISQPDEKTPEVTPGYDEPDEKGEKVFPGETDLDAVPEDALIVKANLDDDGDKKKPDENFNMAPRSPKRKYQSSSESEPEEDLEKEDDKIEGTPTVDDVDDDEGREKPEDNDEKTSESDTDEKKSKSSVSDDEDKFDKIKDDIDEDKPGEEDETKDDDKDKAGEANV